MQAVGALTVAESHSELPVQRIQRSRGLAPLNIRELWEYRELLYFLIWREVKVRYKQTLLGIVWAVVQPFFTMLVFTIVVQPVRSRAVRRPALPGLRVLCIAAVAALRVCIGRVQQLRRRPTSG
jgi:hypothetical protein